MPPLTADTPPSQMLSTARRRSPSRGVADVEVVDAEDAVPRPRRAFAEPSLQWSDLAVPGDPDDVEARIGVGCQEVLGSNASSPDRRSTSMPAAGENGRSHRIGLETGEVVVPRGPQQRPPQLAVRARRLQARRDRQARAAPRPAASLGAGGAVQGRRLAPDGPPLRRGGSPGLHRPAPSRPRRQGQRRRPGRPVGPAPQVASSTPLDRDGQGRASRWRPASARRSAPCRRARSAASAPRGRSCRAAAEVQTNSALVRRRSAVRHPVPARQDIKEVICALERAHQLESGLEQAGPLVGRAADRGRGPESARSRPRMRRSRRALCGFRRSQSASVSIRIQEKLEPLVRADRWASPWSSASRAQWAGGSPVSAPARVANTAATLVRVRASRLRLNVRRNLAVSCRRRPVAVVRRPVEHRRVGVDGGVVVGR